MSSMTTVPGPSSQSAGVSPPAKPTARMPASGVHVHAWGADLTGLSLAGPRARDLLASITDEDLGTEAFPFMAIREMHLGMVPALVGCVVYAWRLLESLGVAEAPQEFAPGDSR